MLNDPTDLAAQDEARAETARLQQAQFAKLREDVRWLMGHAQGRRIVWRYLSAAGVYRTTFAPGDGGRKTAYNEGMRSMGLLILDDVMQHAPAAFARMTDEAAKDTTVD